MLEQQQRHCPRCGVFTDEFYPSQKYMCKKCVSKDRSRRYRKKGRKHLRTTRKCKECGSTEGLVKNGFYRDGTQRYTNICKKCSKPNITWNRKNADKISGKRKIARAKMQSTDRANSKTLVRKWHYETGESEEHKFEYWLETREHKEFLVFNRFFSGGFLREDLI